MNIIFLDVDGVLNSYKREHFMLDQNKMQLIAKLAEETQAQIVISSVWRKKRNIVKYFQEIFWDFCLLSSHYFEWKSDEQYQHVIGRTPYNYYMGIRGKEIEYWLTAYEGYVNNYVIIDDDSDMLPHQMEHFVKINGNNAFTEEDYLKCLEILTRNPDRQSI